MYSMNRSNFTRTIILMIILMIILVFPPVAFTLLSFFPTEQDLMEKKAESLPFMKLTAIVTSKDDQKLGAKSDLLPSKGDLIAVDKYVYGSVSVGDSVCIQYKSLPSEPQYGAEFVGKGPCK